MKRIWIALFAPIIFVGCAMSFDTLDVALPKLKGQNISVAIDYLGIPEREYSVVGSKVYEWTTAGNNPLSATPQNLGCNIKLGTTDGMIERGNYQGNNGACQVYANRLKALL